MQITFGGGKDVRMQVSLQEESEGISRSLTDALGDFPPRPLLTRLNESPLFGPSYFR